MVAAMEKALLCVLLFAAACWISSAATKAASTHFYRTAHFKKMQEALEKEYYLQVGGPPGRWACVSAAPRWLRSTAFHAAVARSACGPAQPQQRRRKWLQRHA